ncbi:MAG TPA: Tim44/TimA family putative adaptor protein, partial [Devosia sp.]|nr:Tim44/TimA family putative adaptor protein [Devosia sp.]
MSAQELFDYLLTLAFVAASWRMYHAAHPPQARVDDNLSKPSAAPAARPGPAPHPVGDMPAPSLDRTLQRICTACRYPNIDVFLDGARQAYELIVRGYADGDLTACSHLLGDAVQEALALDIDGRQSRDETSELIFVGFRAFDVANATLDQGLAQIVVRIRADMVSVTRDKHAHVVSGQPGLVAETYEMWTFESDVCNGRPNWLLVA